MKNVVGVDDVSTDNENYVNVSGNKKKEIERGLLITLVGEFGMVEDKIVLTMRDSPYKMADAMRV